LHIFKREQSMYAYFQKTAKYVCIISNNNDMYAYNKYIYVHDEDEVFCYSRL
jgi:hypothetical protein